MSDAVDVAIAALDKRVSNLESAVTASLNRIETLIRQQIQDLKAEHIGEVRKNLERVEREFKEEEVRCAKDRHETWERLRELEKSEERRSGGGNLLGSIGHYLAVLFGGAIGALITWLSRSPP